MKYPRIGHYHTHVNIANRAVVRGAELTENAHRRLEKVLAAQRDAAASITPTISDALTWDEICRRYPDEWVCLVEIDRVDPDRHHFDTARVVGHGRTHREPSDQASPWWEYYDEIARYFTGWSASMLAAPPVRFVRIDIPMGVPVIYQVRDEKSGLTTEGHEP
jgi:hypothetical protein